MTKEQIITGHDYRDLQMLSEALTQYVDNDAEPEAFREEIGEPEPEMITRARSMLDSVNEQIAKLLTA